MSLALSAGPGVSAAAARRNRRKLALTGVAVVAVGIFVFPLYWMVSTSLKVDTELFTDPPTWFPSHVSFAAYTTAVFDNPQMLTALGNSAVISLGTMLLTLLVGAPGAYGLARLRLRWSGLLLLPFLVAQLLPTINLALPLFALFSQAGLVNTRLGLVLANTMLTLPFAVIVLRPFYLGIPREMEEAAAIDGAGRLQAFLRVVLPIVMPGLVTVGAFSFVMAWGEFTLGLTLATETDVQPVTVTLNSFIGQYGTQWAPLMAASTVVAVPIVVLFVLFQRFIASGLTAGSVKD
jgi:multiple sugar transport system permease protein